ncbi:acylphosphatase [Halalkalibacillus halophilus]|uniref:acylphosphatase n=1 Tax=Halalkalibacillus halophilus TaxID=392827 RepID=UPI000404D829|nr:acylphosphatase [Halalkalibacillus halophilus]
MSLTEFRWMPHHEGAVPPAGQGKRISTYNIALEGWRRGLQLKFYRLIQGESELKVRYSLSDGEKTHHFSLSMGDRVTDEAFDICANKEYTKQYLEREDVPVPKGRMFEKDVSLEEIKSYAEQIGFPLVVKPTDGNAGKGVFANIEGLEELANIVDYVRNDLEFNDIIVETYVAGDEFRIVVIEDQVLGAMKRRPASVVGDGKHTITQLIRMQNEIRKMNPHLTSRLIKVDREVLDLLKRSGHTLKSVPEEGERIYLREKSNLSAGGEAIDVTDELTDELKQIAIDAGKAIPGLTHYGVDMIVNQEKNTGVILEVNARPGLGGHLFPMEGTPRDLAKDIITYYFPHTEHVERSYLFFDFDSVLDALQKRQVNSVELESTPTGKLYGKRFIVSGEVQGVGYRAWVRRQALVRDLHGYAENLDDGTVEVVVMGTDEDIVNDFKFVCYNGSKRSEVKDVEEYEWTKPVKISFEIIRPEKNMSVDDIRKLQYEIEQLEEQKQKLIERHERLINRRTWRYTEPFRKATKKLLRK